MAEAVAVHERSPGDLRKETFFLRIFGFAKIPLIWYVRPKVVEMDDGRVVVRVPLRRRTKNHHGSMYFGALAIGADVAAGFAAMRTIADEERKRGQKVSFVFKDMQGEFLRRPDGDVHFACDQADDVRALVAKTIASGVREEMPVRVVATVPTTTGDQRVARFTLTISLKRR